jgi:hypothetical protein
MGLHRLSFSLASRPQHRQKNFGWSTRGMILLTSNLLCGLVSSHNLFSRVVPQEQPQELLSEQQFSVILF